MGGGPGLGIFIQLSLLRFYLSFGHELRTGMVNKQVIGKGRVGGTWGGEENPIPGCPRAERALYRREDKPVGWGGGHCLRGLSGATLSTKSIYMHSPRWGQAHPSAQWAPGGGAARPSAPQMVTPGPSLGLSVNLYSVGFYLQSPRLGRHILGESQDSLGSHPAPKLCWLCSVWEPRPGGLVDG